MRMNGTQVELVTLSDSLTSPICKPKCKPRNADCQGVTKVVCLDSDTESDGSFANTMVSRLAPKATNDGVCGDLSDEFKEPNDSWLGLHKCSRHSKHWQPCEVSAEIDLKDGCSDGGFCVDNLDSLNSKKVSGSFCKVRNTSPVLTRVQGVESSPSKDSDDCSSPGWDDHLKIILSKLETSKVVVPKEVNLECRHEHQRKRGYNYDESDDDNYDGDYSVLINKLRKCDTSVKYVRGECNNFTDAEKISSGCSNKTDRQSSKAVTAKTGGSALPVIDDSTNALDKDVEKLKTKQKQAKDREEREARKHQLKVEREMLRKEKQEEKKRQQELRKQRNEEEKKRKEELKAEAAERRNVEKEKEKWEKGKFALQNIIALVDTQILEAGLIGGHILTRFAEKGFKYRLVKNPVKKTVVWQMKSPSKESQIDLQEDCLSQDSQEPKTFKKVGPQLSLESVHVSYVLVVLEAQEFLEMITEGTLDKHIRNLQKIYPGFRLCYLINKLMRFLQKREQQQYKTPGDNWSRPPVEQVLAKLVTSYDGVHSRLCVDEAEVSEHIVGLTRSLAECPFKRKLTPLSLRANGDHVVKNDPHNDDIKRDIWLKALYPSMSALFEAYLDPFKTVHEKEQLLQDLVKEGLLGEHNRRIGPACSKRVFRILMAEQGRLHTDDVEEGADAFKD
ncbi:hypothetical protein GOP47_0030675 [Adiantum capillus-veneris]|nr:hypothetical protein GOP47_0030675 [Adiantum capillus-veneris]